MPLPPLIEIVPPKGPVRAQVAVPGSKSITNRALILAALAQGESVLHGALWSEDTRVMTECLQELGYMVNVTHDSRENSNRTITVYGQGGAVPRGGTLEQPLELFVENAGTTARFLAAFVCLGAGVYRLHGSPRMHERPQAGLFHALRELGYRVDSDGDRLPALIHGAGPRPGRCRVSIEQSSQFASALLLAAPHGQWQVEVMGENAEESPYVAMTSLLMEEFPGAGGAFQVEPDCSSGSYFWAAGELLRATPGGNAEPPVTVAAWPRSNWQIDAAFPRFLPLPATLSRRTQLGDSIMTAIVMAPFAERPTRFTDLGRLRLQECERVRALRAELTRCGARVEEEADTLTVFPSSLHQARIETYNDHRMAMCFAVLGLKVPGLRLENPACVRKTFPNFFQKLAGPPPGGLGVTILDPAQSRSLGLAELLAE